MSYLPKTPASAGVPTTIVMAPSVTPDPAKEYYATWPEVMARYAELEGPVEILFDGTGLGSLITLPAGTYTFDKPTMLRGMSDYQMVIECPDGVILDIQDHLELRRNVLLVKTSGATPVWSMGQTSRILMGFGCGIASQAATPFLEVLDGFAVSIHMTHDAALGGKTGSPYEGYPAINLDTTASAEIHLFESAAILDGALTGDGASTASLFLESTDAFLGGAQAGLLAAVTITSRSALRRFRKKFTLADIQGLGAVGTGQLVVHMSPAGARILRNRIKNGGDAATGVATLTASLGHTTFVEQLVAATIMGATAVVQTNPVQDFISATDETALQLQLISTGGNLDDVAGLADGIDVEVDYLA